MLLFVRVRVWGLWFGCGVYVQLKSQLAAALETAKTLKENNAELKDKLLRCLAEQENARIRLAKEVSKP